MGNLFLKITMFVKSSSSGISFPSGDELSSLLQTTGPDFISKVLTIYFSEGGAVPETCYDNTIADIFIGAGGDIDSEFDLFTWEGMGEGFIIATLYYAVETSIVAILEKTAFVLWYGMDSSLTPGSALFLWNGFDFVNHCTFWNHGDILGDGCAAGH